MYIFLLQPFQQKIAFTSIFNQTITETTNLISRHARNSPIVRQGSRLTIEDKTLFKPVSVRSSDWIYYSTTVRCSTVC
jgi:hypothetical protein